MRNDSVAKLAIFSVRARAQVEVRGGARARTKDELGQKRPFSPPGGVFGGTSGTVCHAAEQLGP